MRVPLRWLRDYVDLVAAPEELATLLTSSGTEVERIGRSGEGWDHIVVGRIAAIDPVPHADRVRLCRVDLGNRDVSIVTAAQNVAIGQAVPVALPGAVVGHGEDRVEIQPRRFSGVLSDGMLCSGAELGLSEDASGIYVFADDPLPGSKLVDVYGDVTLDLAVTPNRSDCLSMLGVAREVAALTQQSVQVPRIELREDGAPIEEQCSVEIEEPDLCPRYVARIVRGVAIGPSPEWLARRLRGAGLPVINNVVDVSNYVMWELGQPLHIFDLTRLSGPRIIVRRAQPGESIVTIDGKSRSLTDTMLVIADAKRPVAVAGVMGGIDSEVSDTTCDILIESANFQPGCVRRTRIALGLPSEAARRFERGVDRAVAPQAADRAAQLILDVAGGTVDRGRLDEFPLPAPHVTITLEPRHFTDLLGVTVPRERAQAVLVALQFHCAPQSDERLLVTVPSFRLDVEGPVDLVEEVARIVGYDTLPSVIPTGQVPTGGRNPWIEFEDRLRSVLVGCGLTEAVTYALTTRERLRLLLGPLAAADDAAEVDHLDLPALRPSTLAATFDRALTLRNPLSTDQTTLRVTLMESMLSTIAGNQRRGERQVRLFELGRCYLPVDEHLPDERRVLSIGMAGPREMPGWNHQQAEAADYFDLKGILEMVLKQFGVDDMTFERAWHPALHPGRSAYGICAGRRLAVFGEVHPAVAEAFDLSGDRTCLAEIDVDQLHRYAQSRRVEGVPRFPPVTQDLAFVVSAAVQAAEVEAAIRQSGAPLVRDVLLFDVFRGGQLAEGAKSLAYSVTFQSDDRTLTSEDVAPTRARIEIALQQRLGATLRS